MKKDNKKSKQTSKRVVRKRNLMPITTIVLGFILGGILIGVGIYNNINSAYNTFDVKSEETLKDEISAKTKEIEELRTKRQEEYNNSALSEKYDDLSREISVKENELYDIEAELYDVKSGFYDNLKKNQVLGSVPLIVLGAAVIVFAIGLAMRESSSRKKNVILTVSEEK